LRIKTDLRQHANDGLTDRLIVQVTIIGALQAN
jgi:hypothetical protein